MQKITYTQNSDVNGNLVYKNYSILDEEQFQKIKENNKELSICGYTSFKKDKGKKDVLTIKDIDGNVHDVEVNEKHTAANSIKGYVLTGQNGYIVVEYKSFKTILLIILLLLFVVIPVAFASVPLVTTIIQLFNKSKVPIPNIPGKEIAENVISIQDKGTYVPEQEMIAFVGTNSMWASKDEPYVYLQNPEENDVGFTYTVTNHNTGEILLEETGLIPPGKAYAWEVYESLGETTIVDFLVNTYDLETNAQYNGVHNPEVEIVIHK